MYQMSTRLNVSGPCKAV